MTTTTAGLEMFVAPRRNLTRDTDEMEIRRMFSFSKTQLRKRWKTGYGKLLLTSWRQNRFSRDKLLELVGSIEGYLDVRGIPLRSESLSGLNFSGLDMYAADLRKADLSQCDLRDSHLSEADLRGTNLSWVKSDEKTLWDNVRVDYTTRLDGIDPARINRIHAGVLLRLIDQQNELVQLKSNHPILAWILRVTCRYGESVGRWTVWCAAVVLIFSLLVWKFQLCQLGDPGGTVTFAEALYFSVITFTTGGYGEYKPTPGAGQLLAALDAAFGYVLFGIFLGIISKKVIR